MRVSFRIFSKEKISLQVWEFQHWNFQTCKLDKGLLLSILWDARAIVHAHFSKDDES